MPKIPKELKEELLSEIEKDEAEAVIGENRGQLFVRIPVRISQRLELKKGDKLRFIVEGKHEKQDFRVEVVKSGETEKKA